MQARAFEEFRAIGRIHPHVEGHTFTVKREWHLDTGTAQRPDLAIKAGKSGNALALHGHDDVPGLDLSARGRTFVGYSHHHDLVFNFGRVKPEPWAHRAVHPAELAQILEHRREEIDRYDHVEMLVLAVARALELQRSNADQVSFSGDQRRAAPIGVRWRRHDRLLEPVFLVTRKFLVRGDAPGKRARAAAGPTDNNPLANVDAARRTGLERRQINLAKRLH